MHRTSWSITLLLGVVIVTACQSGAATVSTPLPSTSSVPTAVPVTNIPSSTTAVPPTSTTSEPLATPAAIDAQIPSGFKVSNAATFATYQTPDVSIQATVQSPTIAADLSNVELTALLSPEQRSHIGQTGFAVSPGDSKEFYELYERTRYNNQPVFVTSDSILHVYHLLFDKTLRTAESDAFVPILSRLDWELLNTSVQQAQALSGTPWAEAARRNAAYFAVAVKLLNPDWTVPAGLSDLTDPDLAAIEAHNAISPSAIFPNYPNGEDWSQYVPRGHYTRSEELKRYFVAMMWHGRMTFRTADTTETQQAALLTLALDTTTVNSTPANDLWAGIYEPTVFFVGRSDDLTPTEYNTALQSAYGSISDPSALVDDAKFAAFQQQLETLRAPEILGMVVTEGSDVESETKGLRFMGQRFVPDSFVFRQLIADAVPERGLPKALDFFAVLGSERALQHLSDSGDTALTNYQTNMDKLQGMFSAYQPEVWTQNLYWSWIYGLQPLLDPPTGSVPQFMQSPAWLDKQLNTALGSWTELKHDTILYAKPAYAEGAGGGPPEPTPPKGYVEPVPLLYARLGALAQMTIDGLDSRGLLNDGDRSALSQLVDVTTKLRGMAEKELRGEALTEDEYEFLRYYGRTIEGLTAAANDQDGSSTDQAALVADVANDPSGQVLEEGIGRIFEIYVVVPIEGKLVLTKGGVFSHYEFAQPLSDRLTDEAWREQLDAGNVPALADWAASFVVEQKADAALSDAITLFNTVLTNVSWYTDPSPLSQYLLDPELSDTTAYVNDLRAKDQFIGMTRLSLEFLSFDFQDADHATVTTRESWSDELYSGTPEEIGGSPTKIGERGPYELGVTYTMQRNDEGRWLISKIVLSADPPAWK